jgi:hypothetical protein
VSLPLLTCSTSAWPSRLLYRRGRNSRRDLWITLYFILLNNKRDAALSSRIYYSVRDYSAHNMQCIYRAHIFFLTITVCHIPPIYIYIYSIYIYIYIYIIHIYIYTASLFYLTIIICHIPPIYRASLFYLNNIFFTSRSYQHHHYLTWQNIVCQFQQPYTESVFYLVNALCELPAAIYNFLISSDKLSLVTSRRYIQRPYFIRQNVVCHFP